MKQLYQVEGLLNKGFIGQITYMVCLEKTYRKLDVEFSFDKQRYREQDVTAEMIGSMQRVFMEKYDVIMSDDEMRECILKDMKTEIHTLATLNDEFIGCIHRQESMRTMHYDGENVSRGCIPQESFEGVLKLTVLVFNVIRDRTHYILTVRGE